MYGMCMEFFGCSSDNVAKYVGQSHTIYNQYIYTIVIIL